MKKILSVALVLVLFFCGAVFAEQEARVYFVDVGQGDCTIVLSEDDVMVIDTGAPSARSALEDMLISLGIDEIDLLVLTHPHDDHDGNFSWLIGNYQIDMMWMPEYADDEEDYGDWLRYAVSQGTRIRYPNVGDQIAIGSTEVTVLSAADTSFYHDKNLWSIVTRIDCGEVSIIVTGDAEDINEFAMMDAGIDLDADILRVGHHGSYTSTAPAFVEAVSPSLAVISCGRNNSYGHPHTETLDTLQNANVPVLRTDELGTIVVYVTEEGFTVSEDVEDHADGAVEEIDYVLNTNTKKFHYPSCASAGKIKEKNRRDVSETRDSLIEDGYDPCGNCKP